MKMMNESRPSPQRVPRPVAAPLTVSPAVLALSDELRSWETPAACELAIEHFWAEHPRTPVLETTDPVRAFAEGQYTVTFLWQDAEAEEMLLVVNGMLDELDLGASLMRRVPGSDVWQVSYRMGGDWRASYAFHRRLPGAAWPWAGLHAGDPRLGERLEAGLLDPRNPQTGLLRSGAPVSVVALPDAPPERWGARLGAVAHEAVTAEDAEATVRTVSGPDGRRMWIREPLQWEVEAAEIGAGAAQPGPSEPTTSRALPIVILLDGRIWAQVQGAAAIVADLEADGSMRPCLLVMVDEATDAEDPDSDGALESEWIAKRLIPWLHEHYRVSAFPSETIIAGQGDGGYAALRAALEHPEAIGGVLSQSATVWGRRLPAPDLSRIHQLHAYIEVGTRLHELRGANDRLASELARLGCDAHFIEVNGGADYACWRIGLAEGLRTLVGPAE